MNFQLHIRFKILFLMIVISIITLSLIFLPALQFGIDAIESESIDKMNLSLEAIQYDFEKSIDEAEKLVKVLKSYTEAYFDENKPTSYEDYEEFLNEIEPIVRLLAQNHEQSLTAYIYINPYLFNMPLDIYYADQTGDGIVSKQNRIPIEYYTEGSINEEEKDWWFGALKADGAHWTFPYDWMLDNGAVIRFISNTEAIYHDGKFIGVVGTDINYNYLTEKIRSFKIFDTGFAFLIDSEGKDIYNPSSYSGDSLRLQVKSKVSNGWEIGISVLKSEIFNPVVSFSRRILVSVVLAIIISFYLALRFSRNITTPILNMVTAIDFSKMKGHIIDMEPEILERRDELGILARALNNYSESLLKSEDQIKLFEQALEHSENGLFILDEQFDVIYANKTFLRITNMEGLRSFPFSKCGIGMSQDQREQLDIFKSIQYETYLKESRIPLDIYMTKLNSSLAYSFGIIKDLTQKKLKEREYNEAKYYDSLTNLPNRNYFLDLSNQLLKSDEELNRVCVLINIDNFRLFNGILGTDICNELLIKIAHRLDDSLHRGAIIGRTDGDEFAVLEPTIAGENIQSHITQIKTALSEPFESNEEQFFITYSIGYSKYPEDGDNIYQLLKKSNVALMQAKAFGKNQLQEYTNSSAESKSSNQKFYKDLRFAVSLNEMYLVYQPQIDVEAQKVKGVEVLLRWFKNGENISPAEFIPIAEQSRLIIPIGEFVLRRSFEFASRLHRRYSDLDFSINLSVEQLRFDIVINQINKLIKDYDIVPSKIVFEVTESLIVTSTDEALLVIQELKNMGFRIALDDFGMGYSSLNYLKNVPFDIIKMDRAFIKDYPVSDNGSIASLIVHLANDLEVDLIAEGVETEIQREYLIGQGCKIIQGYYYSKPINEEEVLKYIEEMNRKI